MGDFQVPTIKDEAHSFFGSVITFDGKPHDIFQHMKDKLKTGLDRIDESKIRNEYKLVTYRDYFLPSLRFSLTVHEITKTDLNTLNQIADNYLKRWCGLPPCTTKAVLHMTQGLGIKSLVHMYKECQSTAYVSSMLKADPKVKNCLTSKRNRELSWSRKFSVVNYAHNLFTQAQKDIPPNLNTQQTIKSVKSMVKKSIAKEMQDLWNDKLSTLVQQGNMAEEDSNITWKSIIHNLPRKVLRFGFN